MTNLEDFEISSFENILNSTAGSNVTHNGSDFAPHPDTDFSLPPYVIVSIILSVLSLLLNVICMCAILNAPGRRTTQLRLAASLTMADVVVAFSVLLHTILRNFSRPTYIASSQPFDRILTSCTLVFNFALNVSGHLVCLFNLVAMGLDHYVAVLMPLRYTSIVTRRRSIYLIIFFWVLALFGGYSMFFSALNTYHKVEKFLNYCDAVMHNDYHSEYLVFAVAVISICFMLFTYISVFCEVQKIKKHAASNERDKHNRKTLWTTLLILVTFIVLWLPSCLFQVTLVIMVVRDPDTVRQNFPRLIRTGQYLYCLMLCNCLADPIIYAIRVRDVQMGYRMMYRKLSIALRKRCHTERDMDDLGAEYMIRSRSSHHYIASPLLQQTMKKNGLSCTQEEEINKGTSF